MKNCNRKIPWVFVAATAAIFFGFAVKSAEAGDPIPGVDGKYTQPGPNDEQGKEMPASRKGRNPQTGATIKSEKRSVPDDKDGMRQEAFPTRWKSGE